MTHPPYEFDDQRGEIHIHTPSTPAPWINYLSNGSLHAFVSQAGTGMAWWRNPALFRLTRYRQRMSPDGPGFFVYLRPHGGQVWSPTVRPCGTPVADFRAVHRPGLTSFRGHRDGLHADLTLFVAPDHDALVWDLVLENRSSQPCRLDVFAYVELSQLLWQEEQFSGYYWRHMLECRWDRCTDALHYLFHSHLHPRPAEVPLVWFASDAPLAGAWGDRDAFLGPAGSDRLPSAVAGEAPPADLWTGEPCAAVHVLREIAPTERCTMRFFLGVSPGGLLEPQAARERLERSLAVLRRPGAVDRQREILERSWRSFLSKFHGEIPNAAAARQINTWGPLNCTVTGRVSRAVSADAPGVRGVGFRDTCQDMLALVCRDPAWAERMLLFLLAWQYADGHAVHSIHADEGRLPDTGIRCDNHLWLPLLARSIVAETGRLDLLDREVPYRADDHRSAGPRSSVWDHLLAAARFTESHRGGHGLPLALLGDWNDLIGHFSRQGRGESVFASMHYVVALRALLDLARARGREDDARWIEGCRDRQVSAVEASAWDGDWWLRGFDDDGDPVGSSRNESGRLFLNPQSWSVLAGIGREDQRRKAMDAVATHLDTGFGLRKLWPSFATWPDVRDPLSGYGPGCGENGAVFCQPNAWAIMAEATRGNGERAWRWFSQILPHNALRRLGVERYRGEPYAWASNIVGPDNPAFGWANVTHITGTAAWMDVAATQYLLGVRPQVGGLRIDPCVPGDWKRFHVERLWRGCRLHIDFENPDGVQRGVHRVRLDGRTIEGPDEGLIPPGAIEGSAEVRVSVEMGLPRRAGQ